jgi:hypothetical protein
MLRRRLSLTMPLIRRADSYPRGLSADGRGGDAPVRSEEGSGALTQTGVLFPDPKNRQNAAFERQ